MNEPRTTPARPDLAAAYLKGQVEAERFVEGVLKSVVRGRTGLHARPSRDSRLETELLLGETFTVYDTADGWSWGQCSLDSYVGYVAAADLGERGKAPDLRVIAPLTPLLPAPDFKRPARGMLPMNAKLKLHERAGKFLRVAPDGYVFSDHLVPIDRRAADWVANAELFLNAPYVWGGKTAMGVDCSGLVQASLETGGIKAPRDADMQERALGTPVEVTRSLVGPVRGDLVFWKDHVGVMLDMTHILHANTFHMAAAIEPLAEAVARIAVSNGPISSIRRL